MAAPIPVIFRPLHEHTQTWNWWGRSATTDSEFIAFWRFIVSYLRDTKGIHNVIYAISPQMDEVYDDPVGRILFRWPGDEWVDLVGIDCYHGRNRKAFESNVKALAEVSERVHKPGRCDRNRAGKRPQRRLLDARCIACAPQPSLLHGRGMAQRQSPPRLRALSFRFDGGRLQAIL